MAYAFPAQGFPSGCFSWSPACGETLPKICPAGSAYATFTAKDHGVYTATATCGDSSQFVNIAIEGIDISAGGIPPADETTVPYNIFLNDNFNQRITDETLPGHLQCYRPDNTDDSIIGDSLAELGQITVAVETYGDELAQVKFDNSYDIKLYRETGYATYEKIEWGQWYDPDHVTGSLYVEGEHSGWTTLTATLKTQDNRQTSDSLLIKVVPLDLTAVSPLPYNDRHEICHKDNLVIQVNDNDSDADGLADNSEADTVIPGGDPDLATIRLDRPSGTVAGNFGGSFTLSFPANVRAFLNSDKAGGALGATYQVAYGDIPVGGLTVYIEGYAASASILGTELTAEVALNSGVVCRDSIKYTVIKVDLQMDGVADAEETIEGAFLGVNDDNDDWDAVVDVDDGYNKDTIPGTADDTNPNENDLVKITLNAVQPAELTGSVVLNGSSGALTVWTDSKKGQGNKVTLPATYSTPAGMPRELWVEGIAGSTGIRDSQLSLTYTLGWQDFSDVIKTTVVDVDITDPDGSLDWGRNPQISWNIYSYRFDFQGVVKDEPGWYRLTVNGSIAPLALTYKWTLDSTCGTLSSDTVPSPTHTPLTTEGQGVLRLEAYYNGAPTGMFEERTVKIYKDHLARDYENFGTGGSCWKPWKVTAFNVDPQPSMNTWNCHGSVWHAYDGSGTGSSSTTVGWSQTTYASPSAADWIAIEGALGRGDVVSFWGGSSGTVLQHSHTCRGSASQMYGANNEPSVDFTGSPPATWKWYECSSKVYYDAVNAAWRSLGYGYDFLREVRVHQKP